MIVKKALLSSAVAVGLAVVHMSSPAEARVHVSCYDHVHHGFTCMYYEHSRLLAFSNRYGVFWVD